MLMLVGHFSQQSRRLSQGDAEVGGHQLWVKCPVAQLNFNDLRHGSSF